MFEVVLNMVLALVLASVKSASHITANEWVLITDVNNALTQLIAKKPPTV